MKIYGEKNIKRVVKLGEIDENDFYNKDSAIGFIREHGMLGEFFAKMYDDAEENFCIDKDKNNISLESVEYNGNTYWYGFNCFDRYLSLKMSRRIGIYRQLPDIYDDEMFHWKKNKKYSSLECKVEDGVFEYQCIYKADGNGIINVRYCACDNLHRNKVTMAMIEVDYATNETILKGIKQWKMEFKKSLKNS